MDGESFGGHILFVALLLSFFPSRYSDDGWISSLCDDHRSWTGFILFGEKGEMASYGGDIFCLDDGRKKVSRVFFKEKEDRGKKESNTLLTSRP